jgi:hypothetical protein
MKIKRLKNRALLSLVAITMVWFSLCASVAVNKTRASDTLLQNEIWFYSDVGKTELCGYWNACTGEAWGCVTQYRIIHLIECPID